MMMGKPLYGFFELTSQRWIQTAIPGIVRWAMARELNFGKLPRKHVAKKAMPHQQWHLPRLSVTAVRHETVLKVLNVGRSNVHAHRSQPTM